MNFLPISINLENKKILIVGGGNVAYQKVKNIYPFCKNITVLAPQISDKLKTDFTVNSITEPYNNKHLSGFFIVYACTNNSLVNEQVFLQCEELNILCNRSDNASVSHFHSQAIIESDDLIVSINSKHTEVEKTKQLKHELATYLHERDQRIHEQGTQKGKVYLVGFGPGNPDLLTRKGEKLLYQADVIFYDDLLDGNFLERFTAEKIYVGKRRGNHSKVQNQINDVLYQAAAQGKMVVRLKGGDPLIFGRGSEERYYLEKLGIQVEIIPGISSAIAAAAYADIPLTHRGIASSVALGTAHAKNSFKILESDTSVYYMGADNIIQIAAQYLEKGYNPDYPVAIVRNVSLSNQEIIKTNITEIANGNIKVESPIISIFGNTVNYKQIVNDNQ